MEQVGYRDTAIGPRCKVNCILGSRVNLNSLPGSIVTTAYLCHHHHCVAQRIVIAMSYCIPRVISPVSEIPRGVGPARGSVPEADRITDMRRRFTGACWPCKGGIGCMDGDIIGLYDRVL